MEHIFISRRPPSSASWKQAFPQASLSAELRNVAAPAIVWQHLPAQVDAARLPPGSLLVVLSDTPNDDEGLQVLGSGAVAYCNASAASSVLLQVADVVTRGGLWVGPSLLGRLLRQTALTQSRPRQDWAACLTPRETEIARAAARGLSNREIAEALLITERTVKAHLTVVFEKLQVRDRLQLSLQVNGQGVAGVVG